MSTTGLQFKYNQQGTEIQVASWGWFSTVIKVSLQGKDPEYVFADAEVEMIPSSPLCPIAVPLSLMIQGAIAKIPGVTGQDMQVVGYIQAKELNAMLKEMLGEMGYNAK